MLSLTLAAALLQAPAQPPSTAKGFWPGGGSAWSGTTSYYGFGREVPYGFGFGAEAYNNPRRDVYGPDGRRYDPPTPPIERPRLIGTGRIRLRR